MNVRKLMNECARIDACAVLSALFHVCVCVCVCVCVYMVCVCACVCVRACVSPVTYGAAHDLCDIHSHESEASVHRQGLGQHRLAFGV